jgi:cyclic-di-AMP phosphodiesterase PgpH
VLALTLGLVGDRSLEVVTLYCAMSIGGALVMWRADRSARFITAGLLVAVIGFVVSVTFRLISQNLDWPTLGTLAGLSLANGFLSAGLTFVAFSLLGSLFGITTVLQLLELAHPNQPLLRRLAREAPGTYHHSIVVSSLAENAAELVGADPLFTRVAVYYHDIGKVLRPYFFVENQVNTENVHDELDPRTSAQIILGHVTDGVALARRYRLPRRIIDVIEQHHGTTLVRYFYHRAMERGENVDASAFSYAGPRPQTKEAGIIMLADSVEATVRAQYQSGKLLAEGPEVPGDDVGYPVKPNDKIGQVVDRIINERVVEGQLDDCELTLRDLREIRAAFTAVLSNIYHPRVDYPTMPRATPAPAAATRRP